MPVLRVWWAKRRGAAGQVILVSMRSLDMVMRRWSNAGGIQLYFHFQSNDNENKIMIA